MAKKTAKKTPTKPKSKRKSTIGTKPTAKQEKFCVEYVETKNASEAYRRAYPCGNMKETTINRNACALLKNNKVATRITEILKPVYDKLNITTEYVLGNIKTIGERCMQEVEVTDAFGNKTGEYQFKESGALKAMEMLGKHLKLFVDVTEHTGEIVHKVTTVDIEERLKGLEKDAS